MMTIKDIADFLFKLCSKNDKDNYGFHFPAPEVCKQCPNSQLCNDLALLATRLKKDV